MKGRLARVGLDDVGAEGGVGREEVRPLGGRGVAVGGVVEVGVDVWVGVAVDGVAVRSGSSLRRSGRRGCGES